MFPVLLALVFAQPQTRIPCLATEPASTQVTIISGRVSDPTGASVPDAMLMLQSTADGHRIYARADKAGCYQFMTVPGGYELKVLSPGFNIVSKTLTVTQAKLSETNVQLTIGSCLECVEVTPSPSKVKTSLTLCATDVRGFPVPSASVTLHANGLRSRTYNIQDLGDWGCRTIDILYGEYSVIAKAPGLEPLQEKISVHVESGQHETLKMTSLPVATRP